jgi:poly(3-hydroxybutyrate) depolymerase
LLTFQAEAILRRNKWGFGPMLYQFYEMQHAAFAPARLAAQAASAFWLHDKSPLSETAVGRQAKAGFQMFERLTRRYGKPRFGITRVHGAAESGAIHEKVVWEKPFCRLIHFAKADVPKRPQPKLLIVAPMSGHYATLLRNTVESMLPLHDVYLTDWNDARDVPLSEGGFDLDDYTDYVISMLHLLGSDSGERCHVMAVCQPAVPVLAAVSLMRARQDKLVPRSMILMGGPIDTRINPTAVNTLAQDKGSNWFANNFIMSVPTPHKGVGRKVYPGFLQLAGFISMNGKKHFQAHRDLYWHLVDGDEKSAAKIEEFYDEYLSVMDLAAEFYLQTVERVFVNQGLPHGTYEYRGTRIDPSLIDDTALFTIEGERDDISGVGQTQAAHDICSGIPHRMKQHHLQLSVGHYGVFSGSRYMKEVVPLINAFVAKHG